MSSFGIGTLNHNVVHDTTHCNLVLCAIWQHVLYAPWVVEVCVGTKQVSIRVINGFEHCYNGNCVA